MLVLYADVVYLFIRPFSLNLIHSTIRIICVIKSLLTKFFMLYHCHAIFETLPQMFGFGIFNVYIIRRVNQNRLSFIPMVHLRHFINTKYLLQLTLIRVLVECLLNIQHYFDAS